MTDFIACKDTIFITYIMMKLYLCNYYCKIVLNFINSIIQHQL